MLKDKEILDAADMEMGQTFSGNVQLSSGQKKKIVDDYRIQRKNRKWKNKK